MQVEDVLLVRRMMDGDREAFDELMKKVEALVPMMGKKLIR